MARTTDQMESTIARRPRGALLVALCTGAAAGTDGAAPIEPAQDVRTIAEKPVAHIYYNIATGERVATLLDGVRPSDNGVSPAVWLSDNSVPCAAQGQTAGTSGIMDTPDCTTCFTSTATGQIFLDWGDIRADTVVDCVGITWATQHQDVDLDGPGGVPDGIGDGVEGFGATWAWFDAENGFDSGATRLGVNGFTFFSLPGFVGTIDPNLVAVYTATVDLASTFSSSLVFEVGDTNSIDDTPGGTGLFNPGAGADLDSDGLADFGYALQFIQPGTVDFDDADGDNDPTTGVDGDPDAAAITAWSLAVPPGSVLDNGDGTWDFVPGAPPSGQGVEDAFDRFIDFDNDGVLEYLATSFYGGFDCDPAYVPFAQFYIQMYGRDTSDVCCPVDIFPPSPPGQPVCANGDGRLNFFDVNTFVIWINTGDLRADIFPPPNGDGLVNFFDISAWIAAFNAGCP